MDVKGSVVKTAKPLGREPLSTKEFMAKYADRVRKGKTAKDRAKKSVRDEPR